MKKLASVMLAVLMLCVMLAGASAETFTAVSYTHLTLPTIPWV